MFLTFTIICAMCAQFYPLHFRHNYEMQLYADKPIYLEFQSLKGINNGSYAILSRNLILNGHYPQIVLNNTSEYDITYKLSISS